MQNHLCGCVDAVIYVLLVTLYCASFAQVKVKSYVKDMLKVSSNT